MHPTSTHSADRFSTAPARSAGQRDGTTALNRRRLLAGLGAGALVSPWGGKSVRAMEGEPVPAGGQVTSVNEQTGDVRLDARDVGAMPAAGGRPIVLTSTGGSLDGHLQAALDRAAEEGGVVVIPPGGTYKLSRPFTIRPQVELWAHNAQIFYSGTDVMCTLTTGKDNTVLLGPKVLGGRWVGSGAAARGFLISDARTCELAHMSITGFETSAIELRTVGFWTELNWLHDLRITADRHAVVFTPASVVGGSGSDSFARTRCQRIQVHKKRSTPPRYPLFWLRGLVYDSTFSDIGGNLSADDVPVFRFDAGNYVGTTIANLGFESGRDDEGELFTGCALFYAPKLGVGESRTMPVFAGALRHTNNMDRWFRGQIPVPFDTRRELGPVAFEERPDASVPASAGEVKLFARDGALWIKTPDGLTRRIVTDPPWSDPLSKDQ